MDSQKGDEKVQWWIENDELRDLLGLPPYDPPRFADKVYTHEVVPRLERRYTTTIRFIGMNTEYLDDWEVKAEDEILFTIGHRRDRDGNTVYDMTSDEFTTLLHEQLSPADETTE